MKITQKEMMAELTRQIVRRKQALAEQGYHAAFVRARIAHFAYHQGGPAVDVGTGACGCMAMALTHRGLRVTAVDVAMYAVRNMQEQGAAHGPGTAAALRADAARLPFPNGSYRIAVAFDMLCHAEDPEAVVREMFRVSNGMVMIAELNSAGCQITHHPDKGLDRRLPALLAAYCQDCQRFDDAHHVTYLCETF